MSSNGARYQKDLVSKSTVNGILKEFRFTAKNTRFFGPKNFRKW